MKEVIIKNQRLLYYEGKVIYDAKVEVVDEVLLVQLLYLRFMDDIRMIDLNRVDLYGIQFYRFDGSHRYCISKVWDKRYEIYIFPDLGFEDIKRIYSRIGYRIKRSRNYDNNKSCSIYELQPTKWRLKRESQINLF